jgi:hypothetical protein
MDQVIRLGSVLERTPRISAGSRAPLGPAFQMDQRAPCRAGKYVAPLSLSPKYAQPRIETRARSDTSTQRRPRACELESVHRQFSDTSKSAPSIMLRGATCAQTGTIVLPGCPVEYTQARRRSNVFKLTCGPVHRPHRSTICCVPASSPQHDLPVWCSASLCDRLSATSAAMPQLPVPSASAGICPGLWCTLRTPCPLHYTGVASPKPERSIRRRGLSSPSTRPLLRCGLPRAAGSHRRCALGAANGTGRAELPASCGLNCWRS